jgi:hypothetical protein
MNLKDEASYYRNYFKPLYDEFFRISKTFSEVIGSAVYQQHNPKKENGFTDGIFDTFAKSCKKIQEKFVEYEKRRIIAYFDHLYPDYSNGSPQRSYEREILLKNIDGFYPSSQQLDVNSVRPGFPSYLINSIDSTADRPLFNFLVKFFESYVQSKIDGFTNCKGFMAKLFFDKAVKDGDHVIYIDDDQSFVNNVRSVYDKVPKPRGVSFTAIHCDSRMTKEDYLTVLRGNVNAHAVALQHDSQLQRAPAPS